MVEIEYTNHDESLPFRVSVENANNLIVGGKTLEEIRIDSYNQALENLLKEICIGCAYLKGLECTNKQGCPCAISQKEVVREIIKLKE